MANPAPRVEEEAGLRFKLERSIYQACKRSLEGSDFLVSAFVQALQSYRRSSVCTPFPTELFTTGDDFKDKDFVAAASAVQSFPPLQDVLSSWICRDHRSSCGQFGDEILKARINAGATSAGSSFIASSCGPSKSSVGNDICTGSNTEPCTSSLSCLYTVDKMSLASLKLLDWILRFRHHIEVVQDPASDLSGLFPTASSPWASFRKGVASEACVTPGYVMKIRENEEGLWRRRASAFDAVKAESGSFYAFHGTSAENLHSILRCGLLNMSNSQLQRNGCMFGEGVYLSTDPVVAYSFCKVGTGWTHSFCGSRVRYLLVCEVAGKHTLRSEATVSQPGSFCVQDNPTTHRILKEDGTSNSIPNTYVLVKNSDLVKIRFIFVYSESSRVQITLRSSSCGQPEVLREDSGTHSVSRVQKLGIVDALKRVDWCKSFIVLYIAVLIGVGFLKHNTGRYGRGSLVPRFWPVYQ